MTKKEKKQIEAQRLEQFIQQLKELEEMAKQINNMQS